jgi:hypothetical protein
MWMPKSYHLQSCIVKIVDCDLVAETVLNLDQVGSPFPVEIGP